MESKIVNLKVDLNLLERVEALIPILKEDPELSTFGRVCPSSVIRLAILKGVEVLEQQYKTKNLKVVSK